MFHRLFVIALIFCSFFLQALSHENTHENPKDAFIGSWHGTLGETWYDDGLRLVFHIEKNSKGFITTIDSLDQRSIFPALETLINGNTVVIRAPDIESEYVATLTDTTLVGGWTQYGDKMALSLKKSAPVIEKKSLADKNIKVSDFLGEWHGALGKTLLDSGLKVVFSIKNTTDGIVSAIHSIDQGTFIATAETIIKGNTLVITAPIVDGKYQATLEGDVLMGTWTQYGSYSEMNLSKVK